MDNRNRGVSSSRNSDCVFQKDDTLHFTKSLQVKDYDILWKCYIGHACNIGQTYGFSIIFLYQFVLFSRNEEEQ